MRHNLIQFLSLLTRIDSIFLSLKIKVLIYVMSGLVRLNLHLFQTTLRYRGITLAWVASVPSSIPSAPRAIKALGFGKAKRTRCRIESKLAQRLPLRCRGIQLACLSLCPVVLPSAPRAILALGFGRAMWIRYRMRMI